MKKYLLSILVVAGFFFGPVFLLQADNPQGTPPSGDLPRSEKLEDKVRAEIRGFESQLNAEKIKRAKAEKERKRLERIGSVSKKQLFDDFANKKISYSDYSTGAAPGELEKNLESQRRLKEETENKIDELTKKKAAAEQELQDCPSLRREPPVPSPAPRVGSEEESFLLQQIKELKNELAVEEDYLRRAELWEKGYPGPDSAESVSAARHSAAEVQSQLKQTEKKMRKLQGRPAVGPREEKPTPSSEPPKASREIPKKTLTEKEIKEWEKKGFSRIEIKALYQGGDLISAAGRPIPWSQSKVLPQSTCW